MVNAMPEEVEDEIIDLLGCKREEIIRASGRTGMGVDEILQAVVERIPHPEGDEDAPLQALIFDSVFNSFRGIIAYFKIVNGSIKSGDEAYTICGDSQSVVHTQCHMPFLSCNKKGSRKRGASLAVSGCKKPTGLPTVFHSYPSRLQA